MDIQRARLIFLTIICTVAVVVLIESFHPGSISRFSFARIIDRKSSIIFNDNAEDSQENLPRVLLGPELFTPDGPSVTEVATTTEYIAAKNETILFWTLFYGGQFLPGTDLYEEAVRDLKTCPYSNCLVTNDRSKIQEAGAVVFHIREFEPPYDAPTYRSPEQYYLFYNLESPIHTFAQMSAMEGFFNLTFTYRLNSDIVTNSYFQHFHPSVWREYGDEFEKLMMKKTKFGVIFVSNCGAPSRRDQYIKELKKYIDVDIYGSCGTFSCVPHTAECDHIVESYKFYFAFENSICKDYVTEKIYRAFNQGSVPVVYGGANYREIFPEGSFINVLDYNSPQRLAEYLIFLDRNTTAYKSYFKWKTSPKTAVLGKNLNPENLSWCKICTVLHTREPTQRTHYDIQKWWKEEGWCVDTHLAHDGEWAKNPVLPVT